MEAIHNLLNNIVDVAIMLFEFMGVAVIIVSGIRGIISYIRHDPLTRLFLAKGMALTFLIHWEIRNEEADNRLAESERRQWQAAKGETEREKPDGEREDQQK